MKMFLGLCVLAMSLPSLGQPMPEQECAFQGKNWKTNAYRIDGDVCQVCKSGGWQARQNRGPTQDANCSQAGDQGKVGTLTMNAQFDCDANTDQATSLGAVQLKGDKCLECRAGTWMETYAPTGCNTRPVPVLRTPTLPSEESDGPFSKMSLGLRMIYVVKEADFAYAQALIDSTARSQERLTDGQWVGWAIFAGYDEALKQERAWDVQFERLQQWRRKQPESGAAALMEATYWIAYAWYARGAEYAANVPQEAMKVARERMAKARMVLEDSKAFAATNPMWYAQMLSIAVFQGWPMAERLALFNEAISREPLFDATYLYMANGLLPRWGGSLDEYHRFARAAAKKTSASYGDLMYARLYWVLVDGSDEESFAKLGVPWNKMKDGFADLVKRYPESQWNLQKFAYFACRAGDGKTFNALVPRLAGRLPPSMPPPFRGAYTRDNCVARFATAGKAALTPIR